VNFTNSSLRARAFVNVRTIVPNIGIANSASPTDPLRKKKRQTTALRLLQTVGRFYSPAALRQTRAAGSGVARLASDRPMRRARAAEVHKAQRGLRTINEGKPGFQIPGCAVYALAKETPET
jgi:hypothetical protein